MNKRDVPLKVYSKWMWLALITTFISYIIILSRIAEHDWIAALLVCISVANSLIMGFRIGKEGTTYINSKEVK